MSIQIEGAYAGRFDRRTHDRRWLSPGFSFLIGLPTPARRRKLLLALQVFVDESEERDCFAMGGLIASAEDWLEFSDRWSACLSAPPEIGPFKMHQAMHQCDQFSRWKRKAVEDKLRSLIETMRGLRIQAIGEVMDSKAYREVLAPLFPPPAKVQRDPYYMVYHQIMTTAAFAIQEMFPTQTDQRFEIIFDVRLGVGDRARRWHDFNQVSVQRVLPEVSALMPTDPTFRPDDEFMPLQAADLVAWLYRRRMVNPAATRVKWAEELLQEVVGFEEFFLQLDRSSLEEYRVGRPGLATPEDHRKARKAHPGWS